MPIKWTPETDQILLLKLLETSGVTANYKAIAEAWPKDQQAPTARAISEHLIKIRNTAIKSGAGHFSIPSGQTTSPKSTPRKANISAKGAVKKETNGVKKSRATKAKSKRMISVSSSPSPSPTSSPLKTSHTPNTLNSPSSSSEYSPNNQLKREVSIKAEFPNNDSNEIDDRASPDTMEYVNDENSGLGMGEI